MTIFRSAIGLPLAALVLVGCAGIQLDAAKKTAPPSSPFEAGLHSGYLNLSGDEYAEYDFWDSDTFAGRAIAVSEGSAVAPEEVGARALPADKVDTLSQARSRLVVALDANGRTKAPSAAARAQVMFDCWMQEQEENFQPTDIDRCRTGFEAAMAEVDVALAPPPAPPAPTPAVPEPEAAAPRFYTVFFDFDKADLDAVARQVIGAIIEDWGGEANRLSLVGHTDRAGTAAYNQRLSEGRVQIVTDALVAEGMVGGRISGAGKGESETAVPTADGVREPRNRRVVVTVE